MTRKQFEHAIRAAGAVIGATDLIVIGSQALHATIGTPFPLEAERSIEVDVLPVADEGERLADLIDGSIGEASMFHETFAIKGPRWVRRLHRARG